MVLHVHGHACGSARIDGLAKSRTNPQNTLWCNLPARSTLVQWCPEPKWFGWPNCCSIVCCREGARDGVVRASPAVVSLDTETVTSPQLSVAMASSIGLSSVHSTV